MKKAILVLSLLTLSLSSLASGNSFYCEEAYLDKFTKLKSNVKIKNTVLDVGSIVALGSVTVMTFPVGSLILGVAASSVTGIGSVYILGEGSSDLFKFLSREDGLKAAYTAITIARLTREEYDKSLPSDYNKDRLNIIDLIVKYTNEKEGTNLSYEEVRQRILEKSKDDSFCSEVVGKTRAITLDKLLGKLDLNLVKKKEDWLVYDDARTVLRRISSDAKEKKSQTAKASAQ